MPAGAAAAAAGAQLRIDGLRRLASARAATLAARPVRRIVTAGRRGGGSATTSVWPLPRARLTRVAQRTAIGLTGDDADGRRRLGGRRRRRAGSARRVGPRADAGRPGARRGRRARRRPPHLRRQHRLRPLRLERRSRRSSPTSCSCGCCAATRAAWGSPIRARSCGRRCSCARTRSPRATRARASRRRSCSSSCLNRGVLPHVPSRGSVGASGDLAPLAHLALPLVGEGEAEVDGELLPGRRRARARRAWRRSGSEAKEGCRSSTARSSWRPSARSGVVRARRLAARRRHRLRALARGAAGLAASPSGPRSRRSARCRGRPHAAANVLRLLEGSAIIEAHRWCDKVQDAYSLRCAPQVHGAARDLLAYVEGTVGVELNAATDNPLVLVESGELVSNGNFHGQPLAFALDALAMAVSELASISERRVERLVNPALSDGLPAFLTLDGGLNSGFMIPQYVAAALVSETKALCHPASVDSIPTSAGQEDHVSMGNAAGLKAWQVLANAERALAIELLAGAQAVEFLAPLEPGRRRAGGPRLRARPLAAAARRPPAHARHRGGRRRAFATARSSTRSRPRSVRSPGSLSENGRRRDSIFAGEPGPAAAALPEQRDLLRGARRDRLRLPARVRPERRPGGDRRRLRVRDRDRVDLARGSRARSGRSGGASGGRRRERDAARSTRPSSSSAATSRRSARRAAPS